MPPPKKDTPTPLLAWLAPYLEGGMDLLRGATGLGDQGPAGPTWTNAGALLAAAAPFAPGKLTALKALATGERAATDVRAAGEAVQGIRAFHGSPHDFDQFALSKIGTGEGAQAYGHGLYFAENEGVARSYRNANAPAYQNTYIANLAYEAQRAAEAATGLKGVDAKPEALKWLKAEAAKATPYQRQQFYDAMNNYDAVMAPPGGKMYEVNIGAHVNDFLDWDKPLREQPRMYAAIRRTVPEWSLKDFDADVERGITGGHAYQNWVPGTVERETTPASSEALRAAGIPGIRYLDQGSRAAGEGSRNYVVFNDQLIDILRKYGLLPPIAAGTLGLSQLGPSPQEPR